MAWLKSVQSRLGRRRLIDRAAGMAVLLGGIFVILCVLAIVFVILAEVTPLFRGATISAGSTVNIQGLPNSGPTAVGVDRHRQIAFVLSESSDLTLIPLHVEQPEPKSMPIEGLNSALPTSFALGEGSDALVGTSDGRAIPVSISFTGGFSGAKRSVSPVVQCKAPIIIDRENRRLQNVVFSAPEGKSTVAAQVDERTLLIRSAVQSKNLLGKVSEKTAESAVDVPTDGKVSSLLLHEKGDLLIAGTSLGEIWLYKITEHTGAFTKFKVSTSPVTVLGFLSGDQTLIVGDAHGHVSSWMIKRNYSSGGVTILLNHEFESHSGPVSFFSRSRRNKSFLTGDHSGELKLHYGTSGKTLLTFAAGEVSALALSPKADAVIVLAKQGAINEWGLENAHPEATIGTLFSKVWYEGRDHPEYTWQSTASDEIEPKLSLVPLIFGTLKGTLYALLFAVPLSVLAALYSSQFMHPNLKGYIKPAVELMAALPSVVIGFVAGLWLAPRIEEHLIGLFISPLVIAALVLAALGTWRMLPKRISAVLRPGMEVILLIFIAAGGIWLSFAAGDVLTQTLFTGDLQGYLREALGLTYDQRNSVVVAVAIGFAVIPLIFTITEDALSSVPQSLVAASLALGATKWQTAIRIVLPSASPAIFSAVMIGFGRAVGETMIVLMATGNTPLLDWSPFNGFRALSANIAVEMPEAAVEGTLYRVLFLTALLLFVITFIVNMVSEVVRLRLRRKYQQG